VPGEGGLHKAGNNGHAHHGKVAPGPSSTEPGESIKNADGNTFPSGLRLFTRQRSGRHVGAKDKNERGLVLQSRETAYAVRT